MLFWRAQNNMAQVFGYFLELFETSRKTVYFIVFYVILIVINFLGIPRLRFLKGLNYKKVFLLIVMTGLLLRVGWIFYSPHVPKYEWNAEHMLENDLINIHAIDATKGVWFCDENGNPMGRRPIGFPILLAVFYKLLGVKLCTAMLLQLLLYLWMAWIIFCISKMIFASNGIALIAVFMYSIYPVSVTSIALITDEHLFLPLFYLGILMLMKESKKQGYRFEWFWYGLVFGYAAMTRTHAIVMPLALFIVYLIKKVSFKKTIVTCVLTFFMMQLINLPWVIRNYNAWGVPVLYTATANFVYSQLNSSAKPEGGGHIPVEGEEGFTYDIENASNVGVQHTICTKKIAEWIAKHPYDMFKLGVSRLIVFMRSDRQGGDWPIWHQLYPGSYDKNREVPERTKEIFSEACFIFYYLVLYSSLCSLGLILWRKQKFSKDKKVNYVRLYTLLVPVMLYCALHFFIYPDKKYRFPIEPAMIIIASFIIYIFVYRLNFKNMFLRNKIGGDSC